MSSCGGASGSWGGGNGGSTKARAGIIMGRGCMALAAAVWPGGKESRWSNMVCCRISLMYLRASGKALWWMDIKY